MMSTIGKALKYALIGVSLLVVLLWLRSYFKADSLQYLTPSAQGESSSWRLISSFGSTVLIYGGATIKPGSESAYDELFLQERPEWALGWSWESTDVNDDYTWRLAKVRLTNISYETYASTPRNNDNATAYYTAILSVPHWLILLTTALIPSVAAIARWKRYRSTKGRGMPVIPIASQAEKAAGTGQV